MKQQGRCAFSSHELAKLGSREIATEECMEAMVRVESAIAVLEQALAWMRAVNTTLQPLGKRKAA